MMNTETL